MRRTPLAGATCARGLLWRLRPLRSETLVRIAPCAASGLRDAAALVHALRHATPADLGPLLRRLEWDRGPDRWAMIAATDFLASSFTWRWPGLPAARGLGLALLQAVPPLKSALARQMMFGRR